MFVAKRISVPASTRAMLFDLDGVLIDSLSLDFEIVEDLLSSEVGRPVRVPSDAIRDRFALAIPDFWQGIVDELQLNLSPASIARLVRQHESARASWPVVVQEGVAEVIEDARARHIAVGVVSNNPRSKIAEIIQKADLRVDVFVGYDEAGLRRKPAPDTYAAAAERLNVNLSDCVAIEDSCLGAEAAHAASIRTVGVATGGTSFEELATSPYIEACYTHFGPCYVTLGRNGVTNKVLDTPNDFVSHMVEHIAWRLGCSIDLHWTNDDWHELGRSIGQEVRKFTMLRAKACTIGMIDDGSAEIRLEDAPSGSLSVRSSHQVDLEWFLNSRVEQLNNGLPLVRLLQGLVDSADLQLDVLVSSYEDPHHTWEGIFRGIGVALDQMFNEAVPSPSIGDAYHEIRTPVSMASGGAVGRVAPGKAQERVVEKGWVILKTTPWHCRLERRTAESVVTVDMVMAEEAYGRCSIKASKSVHVDGMADLVAAFATAAGLQLNVDYDATLLSSSHVVAEDIGMAIGRAVRLLAIERMEAFGIHGSGSSLMPTGRDDEAAVRVGVSMEGRKFWKYVPMEEDYAAFRRSFLIGHTLANGLFSEDMDDFIDGFSGGMLSSVIVHVDNDVDPETGWPLLFVGLGEALAGLLSVNPHRRSLIPGVKATLA